MTKKQKKSLVYILIGLALFLAGLFCRGYVRLGFMLAAWAVTGWTVVRKALRNIARGSVFDEHFLMTVATVGAFALGEYPEGAAVMIFFQIGELFESLAVERSRRSISALMDLRPDSAWLWRDGEAEEIDPDEIRPGDILLVKPGQRIPVDGVIVEGDASLDTAQITGESLPVQVGQGQQVLSGCIDLSGVLKIRAESAYEHSTVARILELVENASETKAPTERLITRFARIYTPAVVLCALALAVIPPLFDGAWSQWIKRALSFLVISCPCALVISVPLSFFGGMGAASRQGVIIKGGAIMEDLARIRTAAFDKTGTLTMGVFRVEQVDEAAMDREQILSYAAGAESMSSHPIGRAICAAVSDPPTDVRVLREEPGRGVAAEVDGRRVLAGSAALLAGEGVAVPDVHADGTCVLVAVDGAYAGMIRLADTVKSNASGALSRLRDLGVRKTVLLTGDNAAAAERIGGKLGFDEIRAKLLPQDKVAVMEELLKEDRVMFTGDGVNDAPVLVAANVGVAMGGVGADAAVEAADVVILNDDLEKLASALRISQKTVRNARQNIIFALGVKLAILVLAAFGIASMWLAVFADVGVAVLAICNAMRMLRAK